MLRDHDNISFDPEPIRARQQAWRDKQRALAEAEARLKELERSLSADEDQLKRWQTELDGLLAALSDIRQRISKLTADYLGEVTAASNTAQAMLALPNQPDPRNLAVHGDLLSFAQAATPLHALESCDGRVILSYQDTDGSLRQSHYDTAYGADGKGEEWLADKFRVALELNGSLKLALPDGLLLKQGSNQLTIEFWAMGGLKYPKQGDFLAAMDEKGQTRLRIQLPDETGQVVWQAGLKPDDGPLDGLVYANTDPKDYRGAWTHWAFVKDCSQGEMLIYKNGKLLAKNDSAASGGSRKQPLMDISQVSLGGSLLADAFWHGQIAELRIWNIALRPAEIETNSVVTLLGTEPGLLAYYPFNEAQGEAARDNTGAYAAINTAGCSWKPCSAPIGRLLNNDGSNLIVPMLICAEYSRLRVDAQNRKTSIMLRCLAIPGPDGVRLLDEQRVEELDMKWIGNAQIKPTLLGYIEGDAARAHRKPDRRRRLQRRHLGRTDPIQRYGIQLDA